MGLRWLSSTATAACAIGVAAAATYAARAAEPLHVQVRGVARVDAHTARSAGKLVLSGVVKDDLAAPVVGATVVLTVAGATSGDIEPCSTADDRIEVGSLGEVVLLTNAQSRFCVRLSLRGGSYVAHFEVRPSTLLEGSTVDLPLDPGRKPVTVRFDPEPSVLDLDGDGISIQTVATSEQDGEVSAVPGIMLRLSNEADVVLATTTTSTSGSASFRITSAKLGPAGRGELRVTFPGSADLSRSTYTAFVERRTRVHLEGPSATDPVARTTMSKGQVTTEVRVSAACAVHQCSAAPTGAVAMYLGERLIGVAPISSSRARIAVPLPADRGLSDAPFRLRYVADAPWFIPAYDVVLPRGDPATNATNAWGGPLAALAGLAAAAWVVAARWRPRGARAETPVGAPARVAARAGVTVVRASASDPDLKGRVVDAHEGGPVARARVRLLRAGFEGADTVSQVTCDTDGNFRLSLVGARPGDELVAESGAYRTLRSSMSFRGEIEIALVLRRRQLVDDLVRWARRRGGRFDARPEPTPAHVCRAAGDEEQVATWANALEQAAYGSGVVDEAVESRVNRLAPSPRDEPGSHGNLGDRAGRRRDA
jgi:hypothetical protein